MITESDSFITDKVHSDSSVVLTVILTQEENKEGTLHVSHVDRVTRNFVQPTCTPAFILLWQIVLKPFISQSDSVQSSYSASEILGQNCRHLFFFSFSDFAICVKRLV